MLGNQNKIQRSIILSSYVIFHCARGLSLDATKENCVSAVEFYFSWNFYFSMPDQHFWNDSYMYISRGLKIIMMRDKILLKWKLEF